MEVSLNGDTPGNGWFVEENPIETDEFGVPPMSGNDHILSLK